MNGDEWRPMGFVSRDEARGATTYSATSEAADPEVQLIDVLWQILNHQEPDVARRALRYLSQRFRRDASESGSSTGRGSDGRTNW